MTTTNDKAVPPPEHREAPPLRYEPQYFDGAGYVWPCGCSQHIGENGDYCEAHRRASSPAAHAERPDLWQVIHDAAADAGTVLNDDVATGIEEAVRAALSERAPEPPLENTIHALKIAGHEEYQDGHSRATVFKVDVLNAIRRMQK